MAKLNVIQGWNEIRGYLPVDYESLAAEHRQVETKFGNAKIRDADTLLRFIAYGAENGSGEIIAVSVW